MAMTEIGIEHVRIIALMAGGHICPECGGSGVVQSASDIINNSEQIITISQDFCLAYIIGSSKLSRALVILDDASIGAITGANGRDYDDVCPVCSGWGIVRRPIYGRSRLPIMTLLAGGLSLYLYVQLCPSMIVHGGEILEVIPGAGLRKLALDREFISDIMNL